MKKQGNTNVPRKQKLNKALVELGHKTHRDKRRAKWELDKKERKWDDT